MSYLQHFWLKPENRWYLSKHALHFNVLFTVEISQYIYLCLFLVLESELCELPLTCSGLRWLPVLAEETFSLLNGTSSSLLPENWDKYRSFSVNINDKIRNKRKQCLFVLGFKVLLYDLAFYDQFCPSDWRENRGDFEGWAQDWRKSDGCFSPNLISSPWRRYEDYNISFCKQWKFRCHCSYEQWHLNLHCLQRGPSCP